MNDMKRYLIHVTTNWCGMDQDYPAIAKDESDLDEIASDLALDNFNGFGLWTEVAESEGLDPDEMTSDEWDEFIEGQNVWDYCGYSIEEFEGSEEEWNEYVEYAGGIYNDPEGNL